MTKLLTAITAQFKVNRWSNDWSEAVAIMEKMVEADVEEFMRDLIANLSLFNKKDDPADILSRLFQHHNDCNVLKMADEDTIADYIDAVLADEKLPLVMLGFCHSFTNLSLDNIQTILNHDPKEERSFYRSNRSELLSHPACTQEFIDGLASERYQDLLPNVAQTTKNPETLYKCCLITSRSDNDYYTMQSVMNSDLLDQELLERIALLSDSCASHVLNCRKTKKELINKIALTAKGEAAQVILRIGKTPPETLIALVESNDDPDVLQYIAYNRSKKVPHEALLKAYAKIPDNQYYVKLKFLKRADFSRAMATLARKETGVEASVENEAGVWTKPPKPQLTETQPESKVA